MTIADDAPIERPAEDLYGIDPFAQALARGIAGMAASTGAVLAVNGAWGSGKSSAINLVKHHLRPMVDRGELLIVPFNPWWFAGSDALTMALFQALGEALGPSLPGGLRRKVVSIGRRVSGAGAVAGAAANMKVPGLGAVLTGLLELVGRVLGSTGTVEQEHTRVSEALAAQSRRFLVVVDDIDRLNPDDAVTMFRLVKSVGRLPNVVYLLSFDRQVAERIVSERFPSEGASYLDKIVQGVFEVPPPSAETLRERCADACLGIMGQPSERRTTRFWNVFHDVVGPTIRTPRDVARLGNQLAVAWPAVAGEVDRGDFLALLALQLAEPAIHAAIRRHPAALCGTAREDRRPREEVASEYDAMLCLADRPSGDRERLRIALRRMFPRLDAIWSNVWHQDDRAARDRLISSARSFPSYFALSPSEDLAPVALLQAMVSKAGDAAFVRATLRGALRRVRPRNGTLAGLLLDGLAERADEIAEGDIEAFVTTLFSIADELDVADDVATGFGGKGDNWLRLHWLLNGVVQDRLSLDARGGVYKAAMEDAAPGWSADFARRCRRAFEPEGDRDGGEPIVERTVSEVVVGKAHAKLRETSINGTLKDHRRLVELLFTWRRLAGEAGSAEVRGWTDASLADPRFVVALARQLPSSSYSFGMGFDGLGDRVQRETRTVDAETYGELVDMPRLDASVAELLSSRTLADADAIVLRGFLTLPRKQVGR